MIADSIGDIVHGDRILTMKGTLEQRHEAAKLIIQKIAEEPSNMANTRTKYRNIDIPDGGDGGGAAGGFREGAAGGFREGAAGGFRDGTGGGFREGAGGGFRGDTSGVFRDDRRGDFRGGSYVDGYYDQPDRSRDADPYRSVYPQRDSGDRIFSSQHQRNDLPFQETSDNSVVDLIKTAAATMDKRQILAALTGAPIGVGPPPPVSSQVDNKRPRKTLKHTLQLKVEVPTHKVGHLMGKGGKTVKDMVRRSGGARFAFEDLPRDAESKDKEKQEKIRTVTVTGTFEQVESAFDLIHEKLDEFDEYRREVFQPREY